jgi:hypothetical protein
LLCSTHKDAKSLQQNPTQNSSHHWDLQVEIICYNNKKTIRKKNPVSFLLHESKREVTQQKKERTIQYGLLLLRSCRGLSQADTDSD